MPSAFQSRELIRVVPSVTAMVFTDQLAAGASQSFTFDVVIATADRAQVASAIVAGVPAASGFVLDALAFSDQAGTLDALAQIKPPPSSLLSPATVPHSILPGGTPIVIAASTAGVIAGLRCPAQLIICTYKNTAGVAANVEFSVVVRSS